MRSILPACALLAACGGAVESSKIEDVGRRAVPVPICLKPLARHAESAAPAKLVSSDYWSMVFPEFDPETESIKLPLRDCTGAPVQAPVASSAAGPADSEFQAKSDDAVVAPGPDGFQVVWLPLVQLGSDVTEGPLALVRPRSEHAELYAIGHHRGVTGSRFAIERLGHYILVTASEDTCSKVNPGQSCENTLTLYLSKAGRLQPSARIPVLRVQQALGAPGGAAEYRLTAKPVYRDKTVRLIERVVVRDANQNEIRRSDLTRVFSLKDGKSLTSDAPPLWEQVVAPASAPEPVKRPGR